MQGRWTIVAVAGLCSVACGGSLAQSAASPAQIKAAQTQNVASLTPAEKPLIGSIPVRASLQIEAASARYRLTDTAALFLKGFDAEGSKAMEAALGVPKGEGPAAGKFWSDLMAGALQVRHQKGNAGETLWFNPIFDVGMVIEWKLGAGQWEPDAAWWVLGEEIRNSGTAKVDAKSAASADPMASALQNGETVFRIAGAADWHAPQASANAERIAGERVKAARASLEKLEASKGGSAVVRTAGELMVLGQPSAAANGPKVKPVLAAIGPDARARMRVVSASPTGSHKWMLAMQSPDSPSLAVFITTSNVNTAPIALVDLKLLRFNKQENSHE
jgi:hypothetical protein